MLPEIQVLLLAMAPISELRGAIPVGLTILHLPFWEVFLISFLGNLIPVIFLLLFLEPFANFLSKNFSIFKKFFDWLFQRTRKNITPSIEKYGKKALVIFVGIPLPITGGWTGSVAAFLFDMPFKIAFPLISLGVLIAGIIVSMLTLSGLAIEKYFGWKTLLIIVAIGIIGWFIYKQKKNKKS
ncbi:MAG TPA: small multi-drug export protein [Candidatus Pacearchaeota archaeon]|nr:small multi-drug export protein [Candidatus Pacearchaeota archaeon]HOK93939.1 small multi-drug export protein [Candidatus Pacearchaeota archaeon]HPO75010.1 small multi-drug export protein [Candidatus Pacearchaeota archaeon]